MHVTSIIIPNLLLEKIDALVAARRAATMRLRQSRRRRLTAAQRLEAQRLLDHEGRAACLAYTSQLLTAQGSKAPRSSASRSAVIVELLGRALAPSAGARGRPPRKPA